MKKYIKKAVSLLKDDKGMGVIEIVLIILVLVGLAFVFKQQISTISNGVYNSIRTQVNKF